MLNLPKQFIWFTAIVLVACSPGCRSNSKIANVQGQFQASPVDYSQLRAAHTPEAAELAVDPSSNPLSIEACIQLGLNQNPEIQEMRLRAEALSNRIPQVASLPDPMLNASVFPSAVQTAAGEQEFAVSISQKIPWQGKRATRAAMASEEVNAALAQLDAVELKVVEQIKRVYFQLVFIQQAIIIIENDTLQLQAIENVVEQMVRVKQEVTQQDLLQVQITISQVEAKLLKYRQQKKSAQSRLARLLHVAPESNLEISDQLPSEESTQDIQQLYDLAIQSRPELQAQLSTIQRDRQATCLAQLQHYPDMTFGFNWIATSSDGVSPVANGDDAFLLTLGMNLPIYKTRIEAGVRESEARELADVYKYDRLKDETFDGIADLFAKVSSQQETLKLFRDDIISKQKLTLDQSMDDYQVSKIDFLQLIENWRSLLRVQITEKRIQSELHQNLASLARQIGTHELPTVRDNSEN